MKFSSEFSDLEKIQLLERSILVNSYAYYELNDNLLSDFEYDANAVQLVELLRSNPKDARKSRYYKYFRDYCPESDDIHYTSGFDMIVKLEKDRKLYKAISHDAHLALKLKRERS